ncbi:acyl-CoA dehydrogenase [Aeromicrobium sp. 636]|uniref:Acyl-CoA dehydrogenase family protein n=1 Tax=Aeromicrobium senzhongii TaxID=2663859 RepID=A0A8I0ESC0_9ACTN|nr:MULTISPECIES: acyl-CoA dehydrogenase family protein [Aeromicrobium]MBC9225119.1 acyl-CoA dehydrogenase family protein [Aeromicrobium senzhongii]MCQ3997229.1 acyl-CoA dehydrogenase [Aeromicrobium sp. 636]
MDFSIPEELVDFRRTIRKFVEEDLIPQEDYVEEHDGLPADVFDKLRRRAVDLGLNALSLPEEVGGSGMGALAGALVREELSRAHPGTLTAIPHTSAILLACEGDQRERFLFPSIRGEKEECFALTEPDTGSDAGALKTRATRQANGDWLINGRKRFITRGGAADFATVFAATDPGSANPGITAFLVEKGTPGFTVGQKHKTMGLRGDEQVELLFDDCVVPAGNVLGEVGGGFNIAKDWLQHGRIMTAANCVGPMARLIDDALEWSQQRVQFGEPIGNFQAVQIMLADCAMDLYATRMMVYNAAWDVDQGVDPRRLNAKASAVKVFASEAVGRVADRVLQIFGGSGYMNDTFVERAYRNVRIERIWEGTSEINRMLIARNILKRGMFS